ncbi:hypothetical protein D3C78_351210 [compost metagenome]
MNGQRPPRRGEPRSGESSLPHRQIESPTLWSGFLHLGLSHSLMPSEGRLGSDPGSTRGQDSPLGKSQAIHRVSARDGASQSGPTATFKADLMVGLFCYWDRHLLGFSAGWLCLLAGDGIPSVSGRLFLPYLHQKITPTSLSSSVSKEKRVRSRGRKGTTVASTSCRNMSRLNGMGLTSLMTA